MAGHQAGMNVPKRSLWTISLPVEESSEVKYGI